VTHSTSFLLTSLCGLSVKTVLNRVINEIELQNALKRGPVIESVEPNYFWGRTESMKVVDTVRAGTESCRHLRWVNQYVGDVEQRLGGAMSLSGWNTKVSGIVATKRGDE